MLTDCESLKASSFWQFANCKLLLLSDVGTLRLAEQCRLLLLSDVGTLRLPEQCRQPVVSAAGNFAATGNGDGLRHECNTVERGLVHVQCADDSRHADRRDPTDDRPRRAVGSSTQVVARLGGVRARGDCSVFDRLQLSSRPRVGGDVAGRFGHNRHSGCRHCRHGR